MRKKIRIKKNQNLITVELLSDSKKNIIWKDDKVIMESLVQKPHKFSVYVKPGEYIVESDGDIGAIVGEYLKIDPAPTKKEDLEKIKDQFLSDITNKSLQVRNTFLPEFKIQNAALGIYEESEIRSIKLTIQAFRKEYHRIKDLVKEAGSEDDIGKIVVNFPQKIVE